MGKTLFISDLHLDEKQPHLTHLFMRFLEAHTQGADALYILGDLFEVWVGDDENTSLQAKAKITLKKLSPKLPIYFIHGNRDFLLGKHYAEQSGMQLLPEATTIDLYGKPALIMHGDTLCTRDVRYQKFRKKVRRRLYQKLFLQLPLKTRKQIAAKIRAKSKMNTQQTELSIMDVTESEVCKQMSAARSELLIHGHTHRPAIHQHETGQRIVLPAWHQIGGGLVYHDDHQFSLEEFA